MFEPTASQVRDLIAAAVQAPSADNQHHVRFAIHSDGLTLHADAFFRECAEPHRRVLVLLSYGAVVENLRLRLTSYGWTFTPEWFADGPSSDVLVRVLWQDLVPGAADALAVSIATRHTNRRFFHGPPVARDDLATLTEAATTSTPTRLQWFDDGVRRRSLLRLIRIAETARFRSVPLHRELFESIDFGAGWKRATPERLAPATLEVEPFLRIPFRLMRHWPVMQAMGLVGAHRLLGLRAGDVPARLSPHLGVVLVRDAGDLGVLAAGGAFQRVWLAADQLGLALQPMVAAAVLATRGDCDDMRQRRLRDRLLAGWQALVGEETPMIVFRMGRATRPDFVSQRMSVDHYLHTAES